MYNPTHARPALRRALFHGRHRSAARHKDGEAGSLILDILIGMAIFALIAIIAVSAIGQYRMRAYTQAAMSDAQAAANAISAAVSDNATNPDATYPTGTLDEAAFEALNMTPTGQGARASTITVTPAATSRDEFTVCVEHQGAYALYESDGGIVASGDMDRDGFTGCGDQRSPEQVDCDARGGDWYEATGPLDMPSPVYATDWTETPGEFPWEAGFTRETFEEHMVDYVGKGSVSSTTADWWPTTDAERAEFGFVSEDGYELLTRNGELVRIVAHADGFPAHCNFT